MQRTRLARYLLAIAFVLGIAAYIWEHPAVHRSNAHTRLETHYSPEENLENIDVATLREAHSSIEFFGYSLTDERIVDALEYASAHGAIVCVYLDHEQTDDELRRPGLHAALLRLASTRNVNVFIKHSRILQHTKAYVIDTRLLREGSAHFSHSALVQQDNDLVITDDQDAIRTFEVSYQQAWMRPDNIRLLDYAR